MTINVHPFGKALAAIVAGALAGQYFPGWLLGACGAILATRIIWMQWWIAKQQRMILNGIEWQREMIEQAEARLNHVQEKMNE